VTASITTQAADTGTRTQAKLSIIAMAGVTQSAELPTVVFPLGATGYGHSSFERFRAE